MRIETPFGKAWAQVNDEGALTGFGFGDPPQDGGGNNPDVERQVAEYFAGRRTEFTLPLALAGSAFQRNVWAELLKIPFGETITYAELARRVGRPGAFRAVGRANATNRIALIVPCHRVVGSSGELTGYAFGIAIKEKLLKWEKAQSGASSAS
ncbi:MAG TPA: methylated-DNA--[protein]-cysteine S-methyltransferase [Bryobacteraceae bacterium]|nr:methylated-DNA--[protein]-cysteine S-methyltransferase [Bryobacteraceae bacterium]